MRRVAEARRERPAGRPAFATAARYVARTCHSRRFITADPRERPRVMRE